MNIKKDIRFRVYIAFTCICLMGLALEDRLVKTFMKRGVWKDETNEFGQVTNKALLRQITPKPIEPSEDETKSNPRARSAKLRIAERV